MRRGDKDYKSTTRDVKKLLDELQAEGVEGIVVDLRNNGGGSCRKPMSSPGCSSSMVPRCRSATLRVVSGAMASACAAPTMTAPGGADQPPERLGIGNFAGAIQDYQRASSSVTAPSARARCKP